MAKAADDRSGELLAVMVLFLVLVWITFPLRAWVRLRVIKNWGMDDWLTLTSFILFTTYSAFVLIGIHWGTGQHASALTPDAQKYALRAWYWCEIWYILSTAVLKVAVGAFLLRVAIHRSHRFVIYGLIVINVIFNLYFLFALAFQCAPVSYFWTRFSHPVGGSCVNPHITANNTFAQSGISIITDFTYAILPIFIVKPLQLNKQKRVGVAIVLGLAAVASIATIVRVPYVVTLTQTDDFLFATVDVAVWSTVEPGLGLTVISLASLRPLFRSFFSHFGLNSTLNRSAHGHLGDRTTDPNSRVFKGQSLGAAREDLEMHTQYANRQRGSSTSYDEDSESLDEIDAYEKGTALRFSSVPKAAHIPPGPAYYHDVTGKEFTSTTSLAYDADGLAPIIEVPSRTQLGRDQDYTTESRSMSPLSTRSGHRRFRSQDDHDGRGSRNRDHGHHNGHNRAASDQSNQHA